MTQGLSYLNFVKTRVTPEITGRSVTLHTRGATCVKDDVATENRQSRVRGKKSAFVYLTGRRVGRVLRRGKTAVLAVESAETAVDACSAVIIEGDGM